MKKVNFFTVLLFSVLLLGGIFIDSISKYKNTNDLHIECNKILESEITKDLKTHTLHENINVNIYITEKSEQIENLLFGLTDIIITSKQINTKCIEEIGDNVSSIKEIPLSFSFRNSKNTGDNLYIYYNSDFNTKETISLIVTKLTQSKLLTQNL